MIGRLVEAYLTAYPEERAALAGLVEQVQAGETLNDRKNFNGHITGSAVILSPDRQKLLLVHHKLFDKWLQPGGHWEAGEAGPWEAARREATEETGVRLGMQIATLVDHRVPLDLGTHPIPAQPGKREPAHDHHDFRYAFMAAHEELEVPSQEANILEAAWLPFDDPRMEYLMSSLAKLRHFGIIG